MGFYEDLREDTVLPLLREYGQQMTLKAPITGAIDAVNGEHAGINMAQRFTGYGVEESYSIREQDGTNIQRGDKKITFAPDDAAMIPKTTHTLSVGNVAYTIINVEPLSPGGVAVLYRLQARR